MKKKLVLRIKRIGPEFIITSVAQALYLLQSVLQTKVFTTLFDTMVYGKWSLLISAYTLISMIPFSALDQGINKVAYTCKQKKKERHIYSLLLYSYMLFFSIHIIVFFIMHLVQGSRFYADGVSVVFLIYAFTEIIKNSYLVIDNAYRNRKKVLVIRIFEFTFRAVLFVIAFYINSFTIPVVLWIFCLSNVFILFFQRSYIRNITLRLDKGYIKAISKEIITFAAPLLTWALFGWMQNMISRWYLDILLDIESVALYSVLTSISYFVPNAVYVIVSAYITPIAYQNGVTFNRKTLIKFLGIVAAPLVLYLLIVIFGGKAIVLILSDAKYISVCRYLPFTTGTAILYTLAMLSTVEIYKRGETKKLIIPTIVPGLFMATIGFYIIKKWGFEGAVINYMLGHILYLIGTSCVVYNKNNID